MYSVTKEFTFDAAHALKGLIPGHKCGNVHGHTYRVQATVCAAEVNELGMVMDFAELAKAAEKVKHELDHVLLNDLLHFKERNPTAENLAYHIWHTFTKMVLAYWPTGGAYVEKVTVWETPTCSASYHYTNYPL